jgi:iron complex transport system substrate-binding protein
MRIASLLPSLTETACALGLRDALVGRSHECDFPADVRGLPVLTEPKLDAAGPSRAIDSRVRELVERGLSVHRVDAERLRALAPDVILTQDHCRVCAASLDDVQGAVAEWTGGAPRVLSVAPRTVTDVISGFARLGEALEVADAGWALTSRCLAALEEIAARTHAVGRRPRVACLEWIDPPMGAGNWMPELVAMAGGEPLFGEAGEHSPWLEWDRLCAADPDVIVVLPCGFDLARTRAETAALAARPGWEALAAVRAGRVYVADGNQYFNRPGPRLVDSLSILAEMLHPDRFPPRHRGTAWEALS